MADQKDLLGYPALEELALDLIWSWNRSADEIWRELDVELFEATRNPWMILQTVSRKKLQELLAKPDFRNKIDSLLKTHVHSSVKTWFDAKNYRKTLSTVAYFSMEFMLSEALPIYSGGLGNVAGDQLKAASDLGIPILGIGLLYQQGYFRHLIDDDGKQKAAYPFNSPSELPVLPLRNADGEWLRLEIPLPGWSIWIRVWEAKVGRVKLYLLDTNDPENYPAYRGITSELYGGDLEMRLRQELILGIGGMRLLELLGIRPDVCHLNEGHAAFAVLERIKLCMKELNLSFEEALAVTRAANLFTTHTAVAAGFDRYPCDLVQKYLAPFASSLGIDVSQILDLGRDEGSCFNMAHLAIRASSSVNAVSQLHGHVSQRLFAPLFPRFPIDEIPIAYVTNGVHTSSWISAPAAALWEQKLQVSHFCASAAPLDESVCKASDAEIWQMRNEARTLMIQYGRKHLSRLLAARGESLTQVKLAETYFDPNTLTLGFARRFATYKRPNMLLSDQERLIRILTHSERPVQLFIAGKAHPADFPGQTMIQEWMKFIERPEVRPHVVFLSDYDMLMAEKLVQGVDVWINTPRRPWEACGTSGMKVLVNGGINLSELDGWWAEAYSPDVGWALGDGREHNDDFSIDYKEALQLYDILEEQIIPEFYQRNTEGIPEAWVQRIKKSMLKLTPPFCAHRMASEYTEKHYLPAAKRFQDRLANGAQLAKKIAAFERKWREKASTITFQTLELSSLENSYRFKLQLDLGAFDPSELTVQIYAAGSPAVCQPMKQTEKNEDTYIYEIEVPSHRSASDYCPRILPYLEGVNPMLEMPSILWQR